VLCYVTDRRALSPQAAGDAEPLLRVIRSAIAAGLDWLQLREKDLPAQPLVALAREAVRAARGSATKVLINDRLDVALAAGAAGVHLGRESLPVAEVKRWSAERAPALLVGVSCHALAEAAEAERGGADYVIFGPVFATPSKAAFGPPQGVERLSEVCRAVRIPVLAIGGITLENAGECFGAGAAGVAAIRLFQEAADLARVVARLRALRKPAPR
jgi:thiamine-phosphate pyrophosphorylase